MKVLSELRYRSSYIIGPVFGASLFIYFVFHAVHGDRGLIAYWQLTKQIKQAEATHHIVERQRSKLMNRVNLLIPNTLDRDMLEERARFMLGYSHPGEIVLFFN